LVSGTIGQTRFQVGPGQVLGYWLGQVFIAKIDMKLCFSLLVDIVVTYGLQEIQLTIHLIGSTLVGGHVFKSIDWLGIWLM
jgi:hypothetical protein